ncbi:MAG: hypothetical protein U1F71_10105 [Verrucomicrobiaceae bacterium]
MWLVIWMPLSFVFEQHPHFPSGLLAPGMGFFILMDPPPLASNAWQEVIFPFCVFWCGLALAFVLPGILWKKRGSD